MGTSSQKIYPDKVAPAKVEIPEEALRNADMVFHTYGYGDTAEFREFVILKDSAVESFTADPRLLREDLQIWQKRFQQNIDLDRTLYMSRGLLAKLHATRDGVWMSEYGYQSVFEKYLDPLIKKSLAIDPERIPSMFRQRAAGGCAPWLHPSPSNPHSL